MIPKKYFPLYEQYENSFAPTLYLFFLFRFFVSKIDFQYSTRNVSNISPRFLQLAELCGKKSRSLFLSKFLCSVLCLKYAMLIKLMKRTYLNIFYKYKLK